MYERFIARQPIFDEKLKLFGYELLFRARDDTRAGADPQATAQLMVSSTMLFDWETLLEGASAFINFGTEELVSGAALLLPRVQTVVELPPNLNYDEELIQCIKNLRLAGYRVALDGYARQEELEPVLRYMNFVKVDFRMADKFIARQPIFGPDLKLYAYELLFRASENNRYEPNPLASQSVIVDSLMVFDLERLLGAAKAFVNVDDKALRSEAAKLLDPKRVVIEILEHVDPTREIVDVCRELRQRGYELAIDDFVGGEKWAPLLPMVTFLKVDFRACEERTQRAIAEQYLPRGISLLAEKIETEGELKRSKEFGYAYFQGFFFCKPTLLTDHDIPAEKTVCMRILKEAASPDINVHKVEELMRQDPSLIYKLLRYLNSPLLGRSGEVRDIGHAVRLLGEREFRRWVSIVAIVALGSGKPVELARTAVLRGYFCEAVAHASGRLAEASELFLMGLLSLADALLDRPIEKLLEDLPVTEEIAESLRGGENELRAIYDLMIAYERGTWKAVAKAARRVNVAEAVLPECYMRASEKASMLV